MTDWPKTAEDKQLNQYWDSTGGTLYVEVTMGGEQTREWEGRARTRRLDGVVVQGGPKERRSNWDAFAQEVESVAWRKVTLIEAKRTLNRGVVGQSLVGEFMFKKQFARHHNIAVEKPVILYRRASPAMKWVAERLGMVAVPFLRDGKPSAEKTPADTSEIFEGELHMLSRFRQTVSNGYYFTRVPVSGHGCGVPEWGNSPRQWLSFVRIPGQASTVDVRVYEDSRHRRLLTDSPELEHVFVTDDNLVRGHIGTIAARALMFERQYGRPFTKCTIVCKQSDPAVEEACLNTGGTRGIPPVEVVALGR